MNRDNYRAVELLVIGLVLAARARMELSLDPRWWQADAREVIYDAGEGR